MEGDDRVARVSILIQAIDRVAESTAGAQPRSDEHLTVLAELRARAVAELEELEANQTGREGQ